MRRTLRHVGAIAAATLLFTTTAEAQMRRVTVTATNLAPTNSIAFAPLHLGFHSGVFDSFNIGEVAGAGIVSVAEGGSGTQWQADFAAADAAATRGTVGGLLQAGQSVSQTFMVNVGLNRYFSFANMVVPSNDFFLGNDNPLELFSNTGDLLIPSILQTSNQIWDAGSELFDPAAAAFVGNNDLRTPQNSVVSFNFAELAGFNGLTTGAGYVFDSQLTAGQSVYRIDFTSVAVPEPGSVALLALGAIALVPVARRRTRISRA
ncbi:MAG TPA: spondin domain-containing protein [Gemmatimonadaceae bacterium]|nr:spondin domain-containing protein [Gemmatimonadaceae bacterium]